MLGTLMGLGQGIPGAKTEEVLGRLKQVDHCKNHMDVHKNPILHLPCLECLDPDQVLDLEVEKAGDERCWGRGRGEPGRLGREEGEKGEVAYLSCTQPAIPGPPSSPALKHPPPE